MAMLRFSSIAPAPPSSPCSRRRGGSHRPCRRRWGWGSPASPGGFGDAQTSGTSLGRTCCAARWGRVGSGPVQWPPPGDLPLPARPPRRHSAGPSVRPSVCPCPAAASSSSFRKWRSRAVTARCAPPLTSRHEYASAGRPPPPKRRITAPAAPAPPPGTGPALRAPAGRGGTGRDGAGAVREVCGGGSPGGLLRRAACFPQRRERLTHIRG